MRANCTIIGIPIYAHIMYYIHFYGQSHDHVDNDGMMMMVIVMGDRPKGGLSESSG